MKLPQRETLWGISFRNLPIQAGLAAVLLLGTFAWAPATYPGYWQALDGFIPIFNVTRINALAAVGVAPDLWRGIGRAAFLLSHPFAYFGAEPTTAIRWGFLLCFLLGSLGCYGWLKPRYGDRAAGLAGVIYLFTPTLLATVYIRGSLSDAMIIALLPFALAGLASYTQTRSLGGAGIAVLAILWIWQTQAGLALFCTILLLAYALLVERSWLAMLIVGLSAIAGLTSLVSIWQIRATSPVLFFDHFVYFFQLFRHEWQLAPSIAGWQDSFPFQLSIVALLYTTLYALLNWPLAIRQSTALQAPIQRLWLFGCGGILLLTALTLPWSAPLWQWSQADQLLTYPWQLLLLTIPLWAATGGALSTTHHLFRQTPLWIVLLSIVVLNSYPYLNTEYTSVTASETPVAFIGANENIVVLDAVLTENRQPRSAELTVRWQSLQPLAFDYNVFFQAVQGEQASDPLVIQQLDRQPLQDGPPATIWHPGQIFTATYRLDLTMLDLDDPDADTPDSDDGAPLRYYFGYYDWRDGLRLPVNQGLDDKLIFYGEGE